MHRWHTSLIALAILACFMLDGIVPGGEPAKKPPDRLPSQELADKIRPLLVEIEMDERFINEWRSSRDEEKRREVAIREFGMAQKVRQLERLMNQRSKPGHFKKPLPDAKAQAKIEVLLQELFKDDLAKAEKDPGVRARLAATFLQEGRDTDDNLAGRFVLFRKARDLAAEAGDAATAFQAIEDLAKDFGYSAADVLQMKIQALNTSSKSIVSPESYAGVVDTALMLLDDAVDADDFASARGLVETAEAAALRLKKVSLVSSVRKRKEEVATLEKHFAKWKPFADALAKDPKDPKANTEMGKYHAFLKGNWDLGLVLLSRGDHEGLRYLAEMELKHPSKVEEQLALAKGWLFAADQAPAERKPRILLRAYHWLQEALGRLDDNERKDVEKQMAAIMKRVPPDMRVGEIVEEYRRYDVASGPLYAAALSPDGRKAVCAGADGALRLWDVRTGKDIRRYDGHTGRVWTVAFSPDGKLIASGGFDNSIRLWDVASGREKRLSGHTDYVRSVVFSRDGKQLLSGGDDRTVRLWNVETGEQIQSFPGHEHFVWSVALSPDGKRALSASLDKTIRLWDTKSGKMLKQLTGHKDTVLSVVFAPDGRHALSASTDGTVKAWDLQSGKDFQTFTGHKGYVHAVAITPDGRRALSAGQDRTLRLWELATGEEIRQLEGHRDQVWAVAFSRDGRFAISAGQDGAARVWGGAR